MEKFDMQDLSCEVAKLYDIEAYKLGLGTEFDTKYQAARVAVLKALKAKKESK